MAPHPALLDVADLLILDVDDAGQFCSEVAWHVNDRLVTYTMIADALAAHPRTDPAPETVAAWIMAARSGPETDDPHDVVDLEYNPAKEKLSRIQRHDFREAQARFPKCPHGIPITQRCRICRPRE